MHNYFLHKLKYRSVSLACKVIFACPPGNSACTKMSETLQSYNVLRILTLFVQNMFHARRFCAQRLK